MNGSSLDANSDGCSDGYSCAPVHGGVVSRLAIDKELAEVKERSGVRACGGAGGRALPPACARRRVAGGRERKASSERTAGKGSESRKLHRTKYILYNHDAEKFVLLSWGVHLPPNNMYNQILLLQWLPQKQINLPAKGLFFCVLVYHM